LKSSLFQDLIGSTECLLAQIVSAPGKTFIAQVLTEKDKKKLAAGAAESKPSKSKLFSFFSKKKKSKSKSSFLF
jgi:hypothetical protein